MKTDKRFDRKDFVLLLSVLAIFLFVDILVIAITTFWLTSLSHYVLILVTITGTIFFYLLIYFVAKKIGTSVA